MNCNKCRVVESSTSKYCCNCGKEIEEPDIMVSAVYKELLSFSNRKNFFSIFMYILASPVTNTVYIWRNRYYKEIIQFFKFGFKIYIAFFIARLFTYSNINILNEILTVGNVLFVFIVFLYTLFIVCNHVSENNQKFTNLFKIYLIIYGFLFPFFGVYGYMKFFIDENVTQVIVVSTIVPLYIYLVDVTKELWPSIDKFAILFIIIFSLFISFGASQIFSYVFQISIDMF